MNVQSRHIPRVSVIIPAYNSELFISRAIDSVLSQTYEDYEIIVVDDGSSDATSESVARYGDRVQYVWQDNGGAASARNRGIKVAQGELIAFLDADDAWKPEKLEKQVAFLDANPRYAMVFSDMSHYEFDRKVHDSYLHERNYRWVASGKIFMNLLRECFIFTPTVLIRKECLDVVGLFDVALRTCEDVDLWIRVAAGNYIGFVDVPLVLRYDHGANTTKNADSYLYYPIMMFLKLYNGQADEMVQGIVKARLGQMYISFGCHQFRSGQMAACRSSMIESLRFSSPISVVMKYVLLSLLPLRIIDVMRKLNSRRPGRSS